MRLLVVIPRGKGKVQMPETKTSIVLRRILDRDPPAIDDLEKVVQFFKLAIELEQVKEPKSDVVFPFAFEFDNGLLVVSFDRRIDKDNDFLDKILENCDRVKTKWPKDLCVAIVASLEGKAYPIFQYVIPSDDLKMLDVAKRGVPWSRIAFPVKDLGVNLGIASELEINESGISKLESALKDVESPLSKVEECLKGLLGESAVLEKHVNLSLSSKNPALSQIYSELRQLDKRKIDVNPLLVRFLKQESFENKLCEIDADKLIQVTELDESQRASVAEALGRHVSVVTGPPGCGKTQVILNIMANALIRGKKVLVASKNNKAVDNVKDRFDKIDPLKPCIRFGAKSKLREETLPELERLYDVSTKPDRDDHQRIGLSDVKQAYDATSKRIDETRTQISRRAELKERLGERTSKVEQLKQELVRLSDQYCAAKIRLREVNRDLQSFDELSAGELEALQKEARSNRNAFQAKYSGLGKLVVNLFSKGKHAGVLLEIVERYRTPVRKLICQRMGEKSVGDFKNGLMISEYYQGIVDCLDAAGHYVNELVSLKKKFTEDYQRCEAELGQAKSEVIEVGREIASIESANPEKCLAEARNSLRHLGADYVRAVSYANLTSKDAPRKIANYKVYLPDGIPWRHEEIPSFVENTKSFLDVFKLTSVTSLSAKAVFPLASDLFDMVVIDEASQCDVASAIPLFLRAKQWVVIGDPMQLKHISAVKPQEENLIRDHLGLGASPYLKYAERSLWDYCRDWLAKSDVKPQMLDHHYRCHSDIIGYSNEQFYGSLANGGLKVCTSGLSDAVKDKGVFWIDTKGLQKSESVNVNEVEVEVSVGLAVKLAKGCPEASIGLVTSFKAQAEKLNGRIPENLRSRIVADTVHKFQGDERDIMIYSLVVTDNSPEGKIHWIDCVVPNLVNVAVTRARSALYIVGNKEYIRKNSAPTSPLGHLVAYVERIGKCRNNQVEVVEQEEESQA